MPRITAVVLQLNHITYAECPGKSMSVACGEDAEVLGDYFAKPVNTGGIFRGYEIVKADPSASIVGSFAVVRVHDKVTGNTLHILGTAAEFEAACADEATDPMPLASTIPVPVPELSASCDPDEDGNYDLTWPFPAQGAGEELRAHVSVDGVQAVAAASAGHATQGDVVTWLTANYGSLGTWSDQGDYLRLRSSDPIENVGVVMTAGNYA